MAHALDGAPLRRLLEAVGPSSYEDAAATVVAELAGEFARVEVDALGSVRALVNAGGSPRLALIAHLDEVGMIVKHVDELGCLWFGPIGTLDPAVLVGQRVRILSAAGPVPGVVGALPPHHGVGERKPRLEELWIDVGASTAEEVPVQAGDAVVLEAPPVRVLGDRIAARALDNRLGVLAGLEIARLLADAPEPRAEVALIASGREETSYGGAAAASAAYAPDLALVIDCTFASDVPVDGFARRVGHRPLGSGPTISRGGPHSDRLARQLLLLARELEISHTIEAEGGSAGTDADAVHGLAPGIACAGIGIPVRHLHSPGEIADLGDVERAIELGVAFCLGAGHAQALRAEREA